MASDELGSLNSLEEYFWAREWLEMWRQVGLAVEQWYELYEPFMFRGTPRQPRA